MVRGDKMAFDENLAKRIRDALARKGIEEKKMFGGIGYLLNGNLLVGVWKNSLFVRLGPEECDDTQLEPHGKEVNITRRDVDLAHDASDVVQCPRRRHRSSAMRLNTALQPEVARLRAGS